MPALDQIRGYLGLSPVGSDQRPSLVLLLIVVVIAVAVGYAVTGLAGLPEAVSLVAIIAIVGVGLGLGMAAKRRP